MWKNECNKFSPNIFNKNKCANCYRIREQHSDEALEINKQTRIVSKCGYLSVAPNWGADNEGSSSSFAKQFSRTSKRWQRRWFVLYDDGELTYSVDDHPETIPQAVINLNNVFEIAEADSITDNEHSLAIVAPDGIHFVKATCKEESRMWLNIMKLFPQTSISQTRTTANGGRAKRSQTFPGMRSFISNGNAFPVAANNNNNRNTAEAKLDNLNLPAAEADKIDPPIIDKEDISSKSNSSQLTSMTTPPTPPLTSPPTQRKYTSSNVNSPNSNSSALRVKKTPQTSSRSPSPPTLAKTTTSPSSVTSTPVRKLSSASVTVRTSVVEKVYLDKGFQYDKAAQPDAAEASEPAKKRFSGSESVINKKRSGPSSSLSSLESFRRGSNSFGFEKISTSATSSSSSKSHRRTTSTSSSSSSGHSPPASECRGSPDGCGLQDLSSSPPNSTPEIMSKKGWLMKLGLTKEWHKYWFVLQDVALLYYRDPSAESLGFLDGIVDLGLVRGIEKRDLPRNFGFSIETYEGKTVVLSAITNGIRNSWITCLKKAAGLDSQPEDSSSDDKFDYNKSHTGLASTGRSFSRTSFEDLPVITTARLVRSSPVVSSPASPCHRSINFNNLDESDETSKKDTHSNSTASNLSTSSSSIGGDGILVDLLETEVDSLKAQLEKTQNDLVVLHHSNIDLESQLRQQTSSSSSSSASSSSKRYHPITSPVSSSITNRVVADPDEGETLSKAKSTIAKQSAEILSLRNQLGMNQLQLKQRSESLQTAESSLAEITSKLRHVEDNTEKESERMRREYERTISHSEKEAEKWKMLYESTYHDYDRELRSWHDKLAQLEKERELSNSAFAEEGRRRETIITDLSDQLKESEERIQELLVELDTARERNDDISHANQETMCRLVVSMEEKFEKSLKHEKEQLEIAFRERLKDHEFYERLTASSSDSSSRRASLSKISTMTDLLSIKVPSIESIETMDKEDLIEAFLILLDHFYRAIEEIKTLRAHLREAQDTNDQLELEKLRFEESFKRTIVMQEQQENLMSKRIQDLTNKLLLSEKTVKQLKERRHSKKNSVHHHHSDRSGNSSSQNNE